MTVCNSTRGVRPNKPYPEFPLFAHNNGQWARKVRGKIRCFGPWNNPTAALERHNEVYPYLKAGVPVPESLDGVTVRTVCNEFGKIKKAELDAGEISQRWHDDLHRIAKLIVKHIDGDRLVESLQPDDFRKLRAAIVIKGRSPEIAKYKIKRVRLFFRWAFDNGLIARPVRYGTAFKPPKPEVIERHRNSKAEKLWTPVQVLAIAKKANPQFRAIVLLMTNCGLSSSDVCKMPLSAIDLESGWFDFPRPKTGKKRRAKLWPETLKAIRLYLQSNPTRVGDLLFATRWGNAWTSDAIGQELGKITLSLGIDRGSPEWFRKTFQTIADETLDFVAVMRVMGHSDQSMSGRYRQRVADERLENIANYVHRWLYAPNKPKSKPCRKSSAK